MKRDGKREEFFMRDLHDEDAIASASGDEYHDTIGGNASGLCPPPFMFFCPFKMAITTSTFATVFWSHFLFKNRDSET